MDKLVRELSEKLRERKLKIATAESCTGGMIAAAITDLSGSSDIFDRGFITYSNESKIELLDVSPHTIERFGAVSIETATEMASGVLRKSPADISISVTGIAGPNGGSVGKPVGLVYIGIATRGHLINVYRHIFSGNRHQIRTQARDAAINYVINNIV